MAGKRGTLYPVISKLRAIRKERGITQIDLSETMGYDRTTLVDWENLKHTPSLPALTVWCQSLGVELSLTGAPA